MWRPKVADGQREARPVADETGNEMEMTATVIHRIADGMLVEKWSDKDELGMLQQREVIPRMRPPG